MLTAEHLREILKYDPASGIFTWLVSSPAVRAGAKAGGVHYKGYIRIRVSRRHYFAHRLAWLYVHGEWPSAQIDHINGVRDDNRLVNLRSATLRLNGRNRSKRADNSSGEVGICAYRNGWRVQVSTDAGRVKRAFKTMSDAIAERDRLHQENEYTARHMKGVAP